MPYHYGSSRQEPKTKKMNKPKSEGKQNKKVKELTKRQLEALERHKKDHGHTNKHISIMKREMKKGKTFIESHNIAMKTDPPRKLKK